MKEIRDGSHARLSRFAPDRFQQQDGLRAELASDPPVREVKEESVDIHEEFDKSNQLHSIPAALGKSKALMVSNMLHVLSAACVIAAGAYGHFGWWYWIGVAIFCGLLIYQHTLVKPNDLKKVNMAFFTTNGIASVVFAIFVILDLFLS